jgi:NAD(P)-dependent dehydrogenase (short-subunit alcohol dehydrogenase family)
VTFAAGLLDGRRVAFAGGGGVAILAALRGLGAWVDSIGDEVVVDEDAAAAWVAGRLPLDGLVVDVGPAFGGGGEQRLGAVLPLAWLATRAVATGALIPGTGGKVLLAAPRAGAGAHAEAVRAGLENLARTLSVEWARFAVTVVAICPGSRTTDEELAELVCFLLSPAGGYFSGCRFDLGAVPGLISSS